MCGGAQAAVAHAAAAGTTSKYKWKDAASHTFEERIEWEGELEPELGTMFDGLTLDSKPYEWFRAVQAQSISSACSRVSPWQQRCGTARTIRQAEGQGEQRSWHQRPHPCCGHAVWQWRLAKSLWRPTVGVTDATRPGALEVKWRCPLASSWRPLCGSWWAGTVHPAPQPSGQGIQSPI